MTAKTTPRAIGVVRVSQRDDDSGYSPAVQIRAMIKLAGDHDWSLATDDILDENVDANGKIRKVSGGWDLSSRPKFRRAVEEVEAGRAQVIIAERTDRFFRDLDVQREVIRRVESAGGKLVTLKGGALSHATAEDELQANIGGSIAQYTRRTAKERSWDAVELSIADGKIPWSQTAPGYRRKDGKLVPDPKVGRVIRKAFQMRASGATIEKIRDHLTDHGVRRSYHGVIHLLRDRVYVGEIHFGEHTPNLDAHPAIIEREVFDAVQKVAVPRGRRAIKPESADRLLARLGVLRCGTCGGRMVIGSQRQGGRIFPFYRCTGKGGVTAKHRDCDRRMAISAVMAEQVTVEAVKLALADVEGRASAEAGVRDAEHQAEQARSQYEAALVALADFTDPAAVAKLRELHDRADEADARLEQLGASRAASAVTLRAGSDWDALTRDEQRELIRAVVHRVTVNPGRGVERLSVRACW